MLERYTQPNELNIKDLGVETSVESPLAQFDPRRDIDPTKFAQDIAPVIKKLREEKNYLYLFNLFSALASLGISLPPSFEDWEAVKTEKEKYIKNQKLISLARMARASFRLNKSLLTPEEIDGLEKKFQEDAKSPIRAANFYDHLGLASALLELGRHVTVSANMEELAEAHLDYHAELKDGDEFAYDYYLIRRCNLPIHPTTADWEFIYERFRQYLESGSFTAALSTGANLLNLLKLEGYNPEQSQPEQLPEERTF